ncbi:MAG: helix-turn-helix domain-containing protein [Patescibacteria group bacterium]
MPKQFLTVKQVSKILGVTSLTIRNWDKRGKLQAYRNPINNYRVYKVEDVEKLLSDIDESKNPEGSRQGGTYGADKKKDEPKKLVIEEL